MNQTEIFDFLETFFTEKKCEIIKCPNCDLHVRLSIEMDKLLMNRPFYWHYLESVGGTPNLSELSFCKKRASEKPCVPSCSESIHFGSPRLHKIFSIAKHLGSHTRQYEAVTGALYPWICMNFTISYESNLQKSQVISIGLNLLNGVIVEDFYKKLSIIQLSPKITDMSYTLYPAILYKSGFVRIKNHVREKISAGDFSWATDAENRMQGSIRLLSQFYDSEDDNDFIQEKEATIKLFTPRVTVTAYSGGLFYLKNARFDS